MNMYVKIYKEDRKMFSLITYPDYSITTFDEDGPIGSLREKKEILQSFKRK
jgi:hypothetical protein